jgi:FlaG/FlaF family flagellin (archaellin)
VARAYAPVAAVLLVAVTVVAAAGVFAFLPSLPGEPPERRGVAVEATSDGTVALTLLSGPPVDADALDVRVEVEGTALARQPPVPFFSARGFHSGPTGAFNAASGGDWAVGETVSFRVAGTNRPVPTAGGTVRVELRTGGRLLGVAETTVESSTGGRATAPRQSSPRSGARATVTMAGGLFSVFRSTRCSTSTKPASRNIRSASASS